MKRNRDSRLPVFFIFLFAATVMGCHNGGTVPSAESIREMHLKRGEITTRSQLILKYYIAV